MPIVGLIIFFAIGIVQLVAVMDGLTTWLDLPGVVALFISLLLAYFPLISMVIGFFAAMDVWNWSFLQAVALFFGVQIVMLVIGGGALTVGAIADKFGRSRARYE